jgi:hypothetical protein
MAINIHELVGRFIAVDNEATIQSTKEQGKTFKRRQLYMDCSRYDGLTGERMDENFPLLEFGGKALEQLNQLVSEGIQKGDLVCVSFVVDGVKYTKDGKTQVMTKVRPIGVARWQRNSKPQAQAASAPEPAPAPQQQAQPQQAAPAFQEGNEKDLPF